jgi:magnesium chelatase family protein
VQVTEVKVEKLSQKNSNAETSTSIRDRVEKARTLQLERFNNDNILTNSELTTKKVKKYCQIEEKARSLLTEATAKLGLTARSYFKMIKVAQTIADLKGASIIKPNHIAESLQYRPTSQE